MLLLKKTISCWFVSSQLALLKEFASSKVFQTVRCHLVPYPGHKMQDWLVQLPAQAVRGFKVIHKEKVSKGSVWISGLSEFLPLYPTFWNKWGAFQLVVLHPIVHDLLTKLGWQWKQHKKDPNKVLNSLSLGCPVRAKKSSAVAERTRQEDSPVTVQTIGKFLFWASQVTS